MMNKTILKKIYLSPPHLNGEENKYIKNAIESNWIAPLGPHVDAFEKEISNYIGIKYAAALYSGSAALHLALKILKVKKNDFVFCSDLTFIASANAIKYVGAEPIFIDSEPKSWNMCPDAIEKAFSKYTPKAVIITDIYGQSANYSKLLEICNKHNVPIVEDAAESLGAEYKKKKCGSFGILSILSFNGNKIITTSGGGMLLSNNEEYILEAKKLATQSREDFIYYEHEKIGYNYRMSNLLAAFGRAQLKSLDEYVDKRRKIYNYYKSELKEIKQVKWMPEIDGGKSSRWLSVLLLKDYNIHDIEYLISKLYKNNIEVRPIWKPMHLQPIFKNSVFISKNKFKGFSYQLFNKGLCLPSGSNLNQKDQDRIINIIKNFLK